MREPELHVVFGAGQVGSQLVDKLLANGLRVRSVRRSKQAPRHALHQTFQADLKEQASAIRAAEGASVVYHCANAPYDKWPEELPNLYRNIAASAQAAEARLVVLDNVYAIGATGTFDEDTPERPCSLKGQLRKALADELLALHREGKVSVTIGRASDFFGPFAVNTTLLHPRSLAQLKTGGTVDVIGNIDLPHSWSYTPDVAEGLLQLGLHPELSGEVLHLPVLPPETGRTLLMALAGKLGVDVHLRMMPPWLFRLIGWFNPVMREMAEMKYQFENPFVMSDARIRSLLPLQPTPFQQQIEATAAWIRNYQKKE